MSCAIAKEVLQTVKREKLQGNALEVGDFLKSELNNLSEEFPIIGDVRGQGLFLGIELVDTNSGNAEKNSQTAKCSAAPVLQKPKHAPIVFPASDIALVRAELNKISCDTTANGTSNNLPKKLSPIKQCPICFNVVDKNSFLSHIYGKKHLTKERKIRRTKAQKEDLDRRTLHLTGKFMMIFIA